MAPLPFDVLLAVCAQLPACACVERGEYTAALGCARDHAPGAFGATTELSALRQTSRAWRAAALHQGLRVVVASSRWARSGARLAAIRAAHGHHVRRLVFRSADAYHGRRRRSVSSPQRASDSHSMDVDVDVDVDMDIAMDVDMDVAMADLLEQALALAWPALAAVAVDWFGAEHVRIAAAVQRHAPRITDLWLRAKAATVAQVAPLLPARLARLAVVPYGFNAPWAALQPSERGAAAAVRRMPAGQLRALAVGGADVTPELLAALAAAQPRLRELAIEHASVEALRGAAPLPSLAALRLEHVMVGADGELPLGSAAALPGLAVLSVRHVWRAADRNGDSARGAVSLQNAAWLAPLWAQRWAALRVLALPAIADADARALALACPALARLVTHSLDYAGPRLSAAGLAALLAGLPRLAHVAIEQRRADGSPGYDVAGAALCRLLGCADDADDDARFGDRLLRVDRRRLPSVCAAPLPCLRSLCIPAASFTAPALDALVLQLPGLLFLSVTLRSSPTATQAPSALLRPHHPLRRLALRADEDMLADPRWLSSWLAERFPALRECCTNHARSHRQTLAELRALAPAVSFTRLSSRALQTTCN